jgi:hypothetical protein
LSDARYRTRLSWSCCLQNVLFCEVHTGSISFPSRIRPKRAVCHHREMAPYLARKICSNQTGDVEREQGHCPYLTCGLNPYNPPYVTRIPRSFLKATDVGLDLFSQWTQLGWKAFKPHHWVAFTLFGWGVISALQIRSDQLCRTNGLSRWARNRRGDVPSWHATRSVFLLPAREVRSEDGYLSFPALRWRLRTAGLWPRGSLRRNGASRPGGSCSF